MNGNSQCPGDNDSVQVAGMVGNQYIRSIRVKMFMSRDFKWCKGAHEKQAGTDVRQFLAPAFERGEHDHQPGKQGKEQEYRPGIERI